MTAKNKTKRKSQVARIEKTLADHTTELKALTDKLAEARVQINAILRRVPPKKTRPRKAPPTPNCPPLIPYSVWNPKAKSAAKSAKAAPTTRQSKKTRRKPKPTETAEPDYEGGIPGLAEIRDSRTARRA